MFVRRHLALVATLILALYLRIGTGLLWDEGQLLHPDERFLTMVAEKVRLTPHPSCNDGSVSWFGCISRTAGWYFDARTNPLSPYNNGESYYVYGTLPLTITRITAETIKAVTPEYDKLSNSWLFGWIAKVRWIEHLLRHGNEITNYDNIFIVGRILSSLFDLLTIFGVYLIGKALYSEKAGIYGALFLALSVQNIQLSHFMGTENFVAAFITWCALTLIYSCHSFRNGKALRARGWLCLSGLLLGFALASKISAVFFLPIAVMGIWGAVFYSINDYFDRIKLRSIFVETSLGATIIFVAFAVIGFRLGQPSAFEGSSFVLSGQFIDNMKRIKELTDGGEWPPNVQWAGRLPILFTLKHMLLWEQGWGFFIAWILGFTFSLYELIKLKRWRHSVVIIWPLIFLLYQSTRFVKFGRYLSIAYPFFAICAGYFIAEATIRYLRPRFHLAASTLAVVLLTYSFWWAGAFTSIYHYPHTRLRASRWMFQNVPSQSTIMNEAWDDSMPMRTDGNDGYDAVSKFAFREVSHNHFEPDTDKKVEQLLQAIEKSDYISLSSNRVYDTVPRLYRRYPMTKRYFELLFSGQLGFELVHEEVQHPTFFGLSINDDSAVESFTVYDHPKTLLFKKTASFNIQSIRNDLFNFPEGTFEPVTAATTEEVSWPF